MKSLAVFLMAVLLVDSRAIEDHKFVDYDKEDCIDVLKLDRVVIMKLYDVDLPPDNNEDFNKFVVCDSKKRGLMSDDGEVLFDAITNLLLQSDDARKLNKIQFYAFKTIISSAVNKCRSSATSLDAGQNMIRVNACIYRKLNHVKKSIE